MRFLHDDHELRRPFRFGQPKLASSSARQRPDGPCPQTLGKSDRDSRRLVELSATRAWTHLEMS
jgi:hypothetical protein